MDSPFSPGASHSTKSQNRFKKEKRNLSYADLHSEVMNDVNNMPPSGLQQKQQVRSKEIENDELVKYMSKLPSYLEKNEKVQDKPLHIGVLDWRSLENWQYYHSKMPGRSSRHSASSSNTSSSFLADGSSNHYRRVHSCSPASKKGRRPTLQSYLNISPVEGHFEFVQSSAGDASKFQNIKGVPSNHLDGRKNIPREYQFSNMKSSEIKLKECKKKNLDLQSIPKMRTSRNFENYGAPSSSKGNLKVQDDAPIMESEKLHNQYDSSIHYHSPDRHKNVVLLMPRDGAGSKHAGISNHFGLPEDKNGQEPTKSPQMSSERCHFEEVYHTELCSSISHSCPLPHEIDGIKKSQMGQHIFVDQMSVKLSGSPSSALKSVSPARNKIMEEKLSMMHLNSTVTKSLKGSDMKTSTVSTTKVRNPSPTHRFSMGLDSIGRSSNSKGGAGIPQVSSNAVTAKSGAERADASACSNNSRSDKPNVVSRDRSSPLKRLLDPLLKPKAANSHFAQQSQKDSISTDRASTSFEGPRESSSVNLVKVKLDITSLRTGNLDDSCNVEKQGSTLQAYLQIAVKNDLPLFTFAVDNNSDVLAATVRKFSSRKDDPSWIYTFFTIHEMKKRNGGWLSHGSKGKDYVPNVVAQMKVSDLPFSNSGGDHYADPFSTREYVLFAVDLRPFNQQTSDVQPNDELAAIVVKFPKSTITDLKGSLQDVRGSSNSKNLQALFSTTVILPGGVHGQPSKGEPSPLIERWLSGGLCDCGGWDLGCRVKVLGNQNQKSTGQFELFSQSMEEVLESRPFLTLSSLKNGIFSVEFDSSISLLQAFSICIAVLDGKKSAELQQQSNLFEEKLTEETTLQVNYGIKAPKEAQVDVPAGYASHPPHSPVGRV